MNIGCITTGNSSMMISQEKGYLSWQTDSNLKEHSSKISQMDMDSTID